MVDALRAAGSSFDVKMKFRFKIDVDDGYIERLDIRSAAVDGVIE